VLTMRVRCYFFISALMLYTDGFAAVSDPALREKGDHAQYCPEGPKSTVVHLQKSRVLRIAEGVRFGAIAAMIACEIYGRYYQSINSQEFSLSGKHQKDVVISVTNLIIAGVLGALLWPKAGAPISMAPRSFKYDLLAIPILLARSFQLVYEEDNTCTQALFYRNICSFLLVFSHAYVAYSHYIPNPSNRSRG
jgi:hypothetical protein